MRITYIGFGDFHRYAGMKQLYHFAQEVCRQGHQAQILIAGKADTVQSMEESPLAEIVELQFVGPFLTRSVRQRVKDFKPDILHVWTPRQVPALAGLQLQHVTGAKLILDHEDDEQHLQHCYIDALGKSTGKSKNHPLRRIARIRGRLISWLSPLRSDGSVRRMAQSKLTTTWLGRSVLAHTVISPNLGDCVRKDWPGRHVHLLYPGVDRDLFSPTVNVEELRQKHRLSGRRVVVYSGTMNLAVFRYFLEVVTAVADAFPEVLFFLIGNDDFHPDVKGLLHDSGLEGNLVLTGIVPYFEVPKYLAIAEVLVQHPIDIGNELRLPAKIPEYMAMGKPIVTYAQGIGEIFTDHLQVRKLYTLNPHEASAIILDLLYHPEKGKAIGTAAMKVAQESFDWENNTRRLIYFYQLILKGS